VKLPYIEPPRWVAAQEPIGRARVDYFHVLETAYHLGSTDGDWLLAILAALRPDARHGARGARLDVSLPPYAWANRMSDLPGNGSRPSHRD
jgi:hypothetical protein